LPDAEFISLINGQGKKRRLVYHREGKRSWSMF